MLATPQAGLDETRFRGQTWPQEPGPSLGGRQQGRGVVVIECAKCGHRNADGTEFCQNCGTFLGYEGKKLEALPGSVLLTLTPTMVTVAPGSQAAAEVRIRNKSNIVDQYEIQVTGEPAAWAFAEPGTLSLFPDKEGVSTIRFRPPRSVDVAAGRKPF